MPSVKLKYGSVQLAGPIGTVRLALDYGDASIEQAGRADLGLGHGELRVEHISGDADVTLKSGRARIGTVGGALRLKGSDAGIDVGTIAGTADIATSTGVVQLGDPGPALTVRSAYGPVRITELVSGVARIEASYGALSLGVRSRHTGVAGRDRAGTASSATISPADAGPADGEDIPRASCPHRLRRHHRAPRSRRSRRAGLTLPPPISAGSTDSAVSSSTPRKERR